MFSSFSPDLLAGFFAFGGLFLFPSRERLLMLRRFFKTSCPLSAFSSWRRLALDDTEASSRKDGCRESGGFSTQNSLNAGSRLLLERRRAKGMVKIDLDDSTEDGFA